MNSITVFDPVIIPSKQNELCNTMVAETFEDGASCVVLEHDEGSVKTFYAKDVVTLAATCRFEENKIYLH